MCELSWLPLSERKQITLPKVVFEEYNNQNYGGYQQGNTLVIVQNSESNIPATIAHEYKHYQQEISGYKFPTNKLALFEKYSYNKAIRLYFRTQKHEMEALLFQERVAKSTVGTFWLKGLVIPHKFNEELEM